MSAANKKQVGGQHYKKMKIEIWDFIIENNIPYLEGNAIKYIARWREKGGIADIDKAIHYLEKLKETQIKPTPSNEARDGVQQYVGGAMYGMFDLEEDAHVIDPRVFGG